MTALRLRVGAAVALASIAALLFPGGRAPGQEAGVRVQEVGWWTRQLGATPMGPGAFRVARQPDGDTSVAALDVAVVGVVTSATLTLDESGGVATDQAALRVCTTSAPWDTADPGPFSAAPVADCARAVPLTRDAATGLWRASVGSLLAATGSTSLMVVPDPATGLALFQVDVASATVYAELAVVDDAVVPVTDAPQDAPAVPFGEVVFDSLPPVGPIAPLALPVPLPEPTVRPAAGLAATSGEPVPFVTAGRSSGGGSPKPWSKLLWMVPLAALTGVAAARRPVIGRR